MPKRRGCRTYRDVRFRVRWSASSAVLSVSGRVWRYFSVVRRLPWPRRALTVWMSAPPARSKEAWAWGRSWNRTA